MQNMLKKKASFLTAFVGFCAVFYFSVLFIFRLGSEGTNPYWALFFYGAAFIFLNFYIAVLGEVTLDQKNLTLKKIGYAWLASCALLLLTIWKPFISSNLFKYIQQGNSEHFTTWQASLSNFLAADGALLLPLIIYLLMACGAWIIWRQRGFLSEPLYWYYIQFAYGDALTPALSHSPLPFLHSISILVSALIVVKITWLFFKENKYAGLLMVPYIILTSYNVLKSLIVWISRY